MTYLIKWGCLHCTIAVLHVQCAIKNHNLSLKVNFLFQSVLVIPVFSLQHVDVEHESLELFTQHLRHWTFKCFLGSKKLAQLLKNENCYSESCV